MAKSLKDARQKLQLSKLESQTELLSTDLDLTELAFITRRLPKFRFDEATVSGEVNRTIEGASTVVLTVNDRYGIIKNSGRLGKAVDIKIDGLWFRLVHVAKSGFDLTLTFESREVAVLRTYNNYRASAWGQLTRARFAQILVNEVKEFHIPFICPELKKTKFDVKKSKENKAKERAQGFGDWNSALSRAESMKKPVTIKGRPPTTAQLENAEAILDEGVHLVVRRKLLVCAIMTAIQESTLRNIQFGDLDSVGLFQQRASWGSVADRMNPTKAAHAFYVQAQKIDAAQPNLQYTELCQKVQISAFPQAYAQWRIEAERIVTAYGVAGTDSSSDKDTAKANLQGEWQKQSQVDTTQFTRGHPKTLPGGKKGFDKEDSWTCLQRLADEVQWRCFEVSGSVYFISEIRLFKSAPRAHLSEESQGVDRIDFDYDIGKKNSQITIQARLDRWAAPPGSVIAIVDSGVINGRWLVTEINRSFYDPNATITCKKPRAQLPEPKRGDLTGFWDNQYENPNKQFEPTPGYEPKGKYPSGKALRDAVINNPMITYTRDSQTNDIKFGLIKPQVLRFMLAFTEAGFPITVTALRSDHSSRTSEGGPSAHAVGKAVDMGNYGQDNPRTRNAMIWIGDHQVQLGYSQLIGPIDNLVKPLGIYDAKVLAEHDDHIHVGWPL